MKKNGRAIDLGRETRPVGPGGSSVRKRKGFVAIGLLAESLMRDINRKRH